MIASDGKNKSVVIVSQWFPPEHAPIGYMLKELAGFMAENGWDVEVVTGFPNHPTGRIHANYPKRRLLRERVDNFDVVRLWLFTSERRSFFTRSLNFLSFTFSVLMYLLARQRPQLVFAVLQPLPLGAVLSILAKLRGFKLVFTVQDLHPDVLIDLGLIRNRVLINALKAFERAAYRQADGLAVICEGFRDHVRKHGSRGEVAVIPNWIDIEQIRPEVIAKNPIRALAGVRADAPLVLYAGTIGHVSGAEIVIEAAKLTPEITWLFVGEGPLLPQLQLLPQPCGNVRFLPFQPRELLQAVQNSADVSIVSLLPGKGVFSVPSKVLGYMAAAKPVVASVDLQSETARLVRASGCGKVVPPGDAQSLAAAVRLLVEEPEHAGVLGRSGRAYLEANFGRTQVCSSYLSFLQRVAS